MSNYNGWVNHATWECHLEITNDEGSYSVSLEATSPNHLRDLWGDIYTDYTIDWSEIYRAIKG